MLDHDSDGLESICDNGTLWRPHDIELSAKDKASKSNNEHAEAHELCGPEADVALHVWSSEERKGADIDTTVEDEINSLNRDGGIDDNSFARLQGLDRHPLSCVLVGNQGTDISLDSSGPNSNDENSSDKASHTGPVLKRNGKRCQEEDKEANDVNSREDDDGLVSTEILIRNDGA